MRLDLNADVGESFGAYSMGDDRAVMTAVTSVSIAAGFHAGDPTVLRETIRLAKANGVSIGAHPSFPDLVGFGRREMRVSAAEAEDFVLYQIAAVVGVAQAEGVRVQHVKPHGALFNQASRHEGLAAAIARATASIDRGLILFGPPRSELLKAGRAAGLRVAAEAFADRAYHSDGSLVSRTASGAVIHDADEVAARAVRLATEHTIDAVDGARIRIAADTLCIHGDTPGAGELARRVRSALEAAGVRVAALSAP